MWIIRGVGVKMMQAMHATPSFRIHPSHPIARLYNELSHAGSQPDGAVSESAMIQNGNIKNIENISQRKNKKSQNEMAHKIHPMKA
jgi:hypothetical protein